MKKILVVNANWLGDVVFSSPLFRSLKEAYPQAHVSCLAVPRVKEILESIPDLDEIIIYDEQGRQRSPLAKIKLILGLRQKKFDIAFLLHRSWTRALLVFLAGIPQRVGYDTKGRGRLLTHKVKPLEGTVHRCDYYLNVIESYGVSVKTRNYALKVNAKAQEALPKILMVQHITEEDFLVVLHPGGNWDLKRWPLKDFALLIDRLSQQDHVKVVVSGASQEKPLTQEIYALTISKPVILAGQTTLGELMALMKRANLVVSADSGPLHLATAIGTNVIGLFGPTQPQITGPRGMGSSVILQHDVGCNRGPCYYLDCTDNICMQSITVEDVLEAVEQFRHP